MGHKSTKMEHGLSQADLNFLVKNTNRSKKEIKVGLKLKLSYFPSILEGEGKTIKKYKCTWKADNHHSNAIQSSLPSDSNPLFHVDEVVHL